MIAPAGTSSPSAARGGAQPGGVGDVDVAMFAKVSAGLAEGFAEDEVLRHHGLEAGAWERGRVRWTRQLVEDGTEGPAFAAYQRALFSREDELGREVAPIDRELEAWLGFLAAMQVERPAAILERTGLRMPDLSRLSRQWKTRLDGDEELRKRAEERRAAGVDPSVPPLRLGTSRLDATPPAAAEQAPEASRTDAVGLDVASFEAVSVAEYVAVIARLERPNNLLRSILRAKHIDEGVWRAERAKIEAAMERDAVFRREVAVLLSFERSRLDVAQASERARDSAPPPASAAAVAMSTAHLRQPTPVGAMPAAEAYARQPTPVGALPAVGPAQAYARQPTPVGAMPAAEAYARQPTPVGALPAAEAYARQPASVPPPAGPPPATGAGPGSIPPPASEPLPAFELVDEGTAFADEATAFELPFQVPAAPLPFAVMPPPPEPDPESASPTDVLPMAVADHARMHVELNAGFDEQETLERWGLDRVRRAAADATIDELKRRDPSAARAWLEAYQAHAAWLLEADSADA